MNSFGESPVVSMSKQKNKRREYRDVNTSEDDSLKNSSSDENQHENQYFYA